MHIAEKALADGTLPDHPNVGLNTAEQTLWRRETRLRWGVLTWYYKKKNLRPVGQTGHTQQTPSEALTLRTAHQHSHRSPLRNPQRQPRVQLQPDALIRATRMPSKRTSLAKLVPEPSPHALSLPSPRQRPSLPAMPRPVLPRRSRRQHIHAYDAINHRSIRNHSSEHHK